jgi:hypothetical protein
MSLSTGTRSRSCVPTHPDTTIDSLTLTVPNGRPYFDVARLLVGGLAARLDLAYEQMDDLQLAVETVLAECSPTGESVTLEAAVGDDDVSITVGPLSRVVGGTTAPGSTVIPFDRLLDTLVERTAIVERDGELWLRLEKRIPRRSR